ncbi:superoxide dismutase [Candidatus Dependentiae bacterium]|nr:superoxide dismutase [Candidatus Dependentiae bacterium]
MYAVKEQLRPLGLINISGEQINDHWDLYKGYVKQVNVLQETPDIRRYGFEYNGMVLHEYYFENLTAGGAPLSKSNLKKAIEQTWGSYEQWQKAFVETGKSRGIGWAILYCNPENKQLSNHFVTEHQNGHIAGFKPILVMDVWEHAYMVDHRAGGRAAYIDAFMKNINWSVVEKRFG